MAKMKESEIKLYCGNCGSSEIGKARGKSENYCKKCGTVVEEMLHI